MDDYEINSDTIALINHRNKTKVYEIDSEFIINKTPNEIMEDSCEYFGSSLEGRQKGTCSLIGVTHKSPVIVQEEENIIFFPTKSPRLKECSWISSKNINRIYKEKDNKVTIVYQNGIKITLNTSYSIINNQVLRSALLENTLNNHKKMQKMV